MVIHSFKKETSAITTNIQATQNSNGILLIKLLILINKLTNIQGISKRRNELNLNLEGI